MQKKPPKLPISNLLKFIFITICPEQYLILKLPCSWLAQNERDFDNAEKHLCYSFSYDKQKIKVIKYLLKVNVSLYILQHFLWVLQREP